MTPRTWSLTMGKTLDSCPRKYFYRYHLARRADRGDRSQRAQEAAVCRRLMGPKAWAGEIVHDEIQRILLAWRKGWNEIPEQAVRQVNRKLSSRLEASYEYLYKNREAYARPPGLLDLHYFGGKMTRDLGDQMKDVVKTSLSNFVTSDLASRIRRVGPNSFRPIDTNASALLDSGVLLRVKPDFAFEEGDTLHVLDWKTGRPDPTWDGMQLLGYSLFAAEHWGRPVEQVRTACVHLYPGVKVQEYDRAGETIDLALQRIAEQLAQVQELEGGREDPEEEQFPATRHPKTCRYCPFRSICPDRADLNPALEDPGDDY